MRLVYLTARPGDATGSGQFYFATGIHLLLVKCIDADQKSRNCRQFQANRMWCKIIVDR